MIKDLAENKLKNLSATITLSVGSAAQLWKHVIRRANQGTRFCSGGSTESLDPFQCPSPFSLSPQATPDFHVSVFSPVFWEFWIPEATLSFALTSGPKPSKFSTDPYSIIRTTYKGSPSRTPEKAEKASGSACSKSRSSFSRAKSPLTDWIHSYSALFFTTSWFNATPTLLFRAPSCSTNSRSSPTSSEARKSTPLPRTLKNNF